VAYVISKRRWCLRPLDKFVITVAGESGAGKSELASEIARLITEEGFNTGVLQQDDYFVFPPKTNHEMRRRFWEHPAPRAGKITTDRSFISTAKPHEFLDFLGGRLSRRFVRGTCAAQEPLRGATTDGGATRPRTEIQHSPNLRIPRRASRALSPKSQTKSLSHLAWSSGAAARCRGVTKVSHEQERISGPLLERSTQPACGIDIHMKCPTWTMRS
jgi:hypothetical protein